MHYRHAYHAGNFADVFKHAVLCGLLEALSRKEKPWGYLETHAGAGRYDLGGEGAMRTGEWRDGIGRLEGATGLPAPLTKYLQIVAAQRADYAQSYPGSPRVALAMARVDDRLVLCEKIPEIADQLRDALRGEKQVTIHRRDGYEAHTLVPPPQKRGLVLIDPPFERPDEFEAVGDLLEKSLARFAGGVHAIWYPLKNRHAASRFERRAARLASEPPLRLALETGAPGEGQMRACAVLVVNPPFGFERDFAAAGRTLAQLLSQGPHAKFESGPVAADAAAPVPRSRMPQ